MTAVVDRDRGRFVEAGGQDDKNEKMEHDH